MTYLNIDSIRVCTEAEGPGQRFAIWVQGCLKRCKNCCNPHMQPCIKNIIVDTDSVIQLIKKSKYENNIEGVTFIGGEPFLQARGLANIAKWCKENNLSVLVFSGYLYEELLKDEALQARELLNHTDVLVDGEYIDELYDEERTWIGSKNQRIIYLTNFYQKGIEHTEKEKSMEILIRKNDIELNGWPF